MRESALDGCKLCPLHNGEIRGMGYDLHITRAADWTESASAPIRAEEWLDLVRRDPEFELDGLNGPYFAHWKNADSIQEGWLDWSAGQIYTKYPDSSLLRKMVAIADRLGAIVVGDDGERYTGEEPLDEYLRGG
jgi:hypothetical protein